VSPIPIAVLASGRGSNLQALLDGLAAPDAPGRVVLVVSNRADAPALDRARDARVRTHVTRADGQDTDDLVAAFRLAGAQLVVLAGWLKKVPDPVIAVFRGRILNVHPALLPAFGGPGMYGHRVHEAVLASGARLSGVTVHLVDEQFDHGAILAQWPVPVRAGDTADTLAERVLATEHRLFPAAVRAACRAIIAGRAPGALAFAADAFVLSDVLETSFDAALVTA
jgi:formyltetrahydrofolate-dependent phosphoribosylglycinamide formyltransferase